MAQNYRKEMEQLMASAPEGEHLLLHSCCGPCSSAVLEQLSSHFKVLLLYYNPNIWPRQEYDRRRDEQIQVLKMLPVRFAVRFEELPYCPEEFLRAVRGLEDAPEGGVRCEACFSLRLARAAQEAAVRGISWFTTTLTVSPHKNADVLNRLGRETEQKYGVRFLASDFKKKEGYKRSLELSAEYGLYRQDYCGCEFGRKQRFEE